MRSLRVAVLDEELPFPLTTGKRIRSFNLLRHLAARHRITILCHRNPDRDEATRAESELRKLGIETVIVDRTVPPKSGPGFYARLAGNLLSPLPYSVASHSSPSLAEAVRAHDELQKVDIWHCEWTPYAQVLRDAFGVELSGRRWSVMAHNVESRIWQRYTEAEEHPVKRWYLRKQWQKFERFESWAYSAATRPIAVSDEDAKLMRERFGAERADVVDNGVDTTFFKPHRDVERDPARILFLGSLDWRPNQDGAKILVEDIFPSVQQQIPSATIALVGRRPPEWLKQLAATTPCVHLFPDVPDVRPFLAGCGMLAVPLRIGGGSRLKILEALAMETPVVSTTIGAEGLNLNGGRDLIIADGAEVFAAALVAGIRRPDLLLETAECGREIVLDQYDWQPLADQLDGIWRSLATGAKTPQTRMDSRTAVMESSDQATRFSS